MKSFGNISKSAEYDSTGFFSLIRMNFNSKGYVSSGEIKANLVEKSHVTKSRDQGRNFNIFYELLRSEDSKLLEKLFLKSKTSEYKIMKKDSADASRDQKNFTETRKALEEIGVSGTKIEEIFSTIAFILHLGNVSFDQGPIYIFSGKIIFN